MLSQNKLVLLCSSAIACFVGHKLYSEFKKRSYIANGINYNDYTAILTTRSPGKIILSGEHAVVYGITALSTSINRFTSITIHEPKQSNSSKLILKLNKAELSWNLTDLYHIYQQHNALNIDTITTKYNKDNTPIKPQITFVHKIQTTDVLFAEQNWDKQITLVLLSLLFNKAFIPLFDDKQFITNGILIDVSSTIPIGVGMGSSAAWSTSLSAAVYYYHHHVIVHKRKIIDPQNELMIDDKTMRDIWNLSYDLEKINHGTPSGIDNTTALYGGYIKYMNKNKFEVIDINKQFVHQIPLLIINTNVIGNTKVLVQNVRKLHNKYEAIIDPIFESIQRIVEHVIHNVTNEEVTKESLSETINELFTINHALLLSIGVGHKQIDRLQSICNQHGFGGGFKITGAGGGGCCIVPLLCKYSDANADTMIGKFRNILLKNGYKSYLLETGQTGLNCRFNDIL